MSHIDEKNQNKLRSDSVVMHFDFPEDMKIECESYLLSFAQYLNIMGCEATATIQHKEGQVIFAVSPLNEGVSTEAIYTALEYYLHLPGADNLLDKFGTRIAVQRREANINKLTNQLMPVHAEIQSEDTSPNSEYIPPRLGERILLLILRTKEERVNIPGDLAEEFKEIAAKHGARYAKLWYYKQVAASAWPMTRKVFRWGLLVSVVEWIRRHA